MRGNRGEADWENYTGNTVAPWMVQDCAYTMNYYLYEAMAPLFRIVYGQRKIVIPHRGMILFDKKLKEWVSKTFPTLHPGMWGNLTNAEFNQAARQRMQLDQAAAISVHQHRGKFTRLISGIRDSLQDDAGNDDYLEELKEAAPCIVRIMEAYYHNRGFEIPRTTEPNQAMIRLRCLRRFVWNNIWQTAQNIQRAHLQGSPNWEEHDWARFIHVAQRVLLGSKKHANAPGMLTTTRRVRMDQDPQQEVHLSWYARYPYDENPKEEEEKSGGRTDPEMRDLFGLNTTMFLCEQAASNLGDFNPHGGTGIPRHQRMLPLLEGQINVGVASRAKIGDLSRSREPSREPEVKRVQRHMDDITKRRARVERRITQEEHVRLSFPRSPPRKPRLRSKSVVRDIPRRGRSQPTPDPVPDQTSTSTGVDFGPIAVALVILGLVIMVKGGREPLAPARY